MQEIITFLKSLLSRKFALTVAAFITVHQPQIPPKFQAIASFVVLGLYFIANVAEKKVPTAIPAPPADAVVVPDDTQAQVPAGADDTPAGA